MEAEGSINADWHIKLINYKVRKVLYQIPGIKPNLGLVQIMAFIFPSLFLIFCPNTALCKKTIVSYKDFLCNNLQVLHEGTSLI